MSEQRPAELAGPAPERLSGYQRLTDWISFAQGTPVNLTFWLVVVLAWIAAGPYLANHPFLPAWTGSNNWNFPLNTGESTAELFIGFLVAAAANRSERRGREQSARIEALEGQVLATEDALRAEVQANTELTQQGRDLLQANTELTEQVRDLVKAVHAVTCADAGESGS